MAPAHEEDEWIVEEDQVGEDAMVDDDANEDEEEDEEEHCYHCNDDSGGGVLVLCDYCPRAAHLQCAGLKVSSVCDHPHTLMTFPLLSSVIIIIIWIIMVLTYGDWHGQQLSHTRAVHTPRRMQMEL